MPTQKILDNHEPDIGFYSAGAVPAETTEDWHVDFAERPALRMRLIQHGHDDHVFSVRCHRMLADGATLRHLLSDIGALYANSITGSSLFPLVDNTLQYADYCVWERKWLTPAVIREQVDSVRKSYARGRAPVPLSSDRTVGLLAPRVVQHVARQHFVLSEAASRSLRGVAAQERASLPMVLVAIYASVLGRYSGLPFVTIGTPVSRRHHPATRHMLGPFMNTLLLNICVEDEPPLRELINRVKQVQLAAMSHQDAPFHEVMTALIGEFGPSVAGLGEVALVMEDTGPAEGTFGGLTLSREPISSLSARRALTLSMAAGPDVISGTATYDSDLFHASTIQSMLNAFTEVASSVRQPVERNASVPV